MELWSYTLTAVGVLGIWLSGKRNYWGWGIGLSAQLLWVAFALTTAQYGFLISAGAYGWVYAKNFRAWRKAAKEATE